MVAKATKKSGTPRRARPQRLPGTEDAGIRELDDLASEYAETRDTRMALSKKEGELKVRLLDAMHRHKRQEYVYNGTKIYIVPGEEDVKVKAVKTAVELDEED